MPSKDAEGAQSSKDFSCVKSIREVYCATLSGQQPARLGAEWRLTTIRKACRIDLSYKDKT
jgi:hypothetical protein